MNLIEKIKYFSQIIFGIVIASCIFFIILFLINGELWFIDKIYPWFIPISAYALVACFLIFLPLVFIKKTRAISVIGFLIASYVFGIVAWMWSFSLVYIFWGFIGLFIGLLFIGVGVVPMAMFISVFLGEWGFLWKLVLIVIMSFSVRLFALYVAAKIDHKNF